LLISVIRALSASETNEQREIEKAKLEKEYKRSDQRLEELVSLHDQDLIEVMQVNMDMHMHEFNEKLIIACMYPIMYYFRYSVHCLKKLHHREKRFMQ